MPMKLTNAQVQAGVDKCVRKALDMLNDAMCLLEKGSKTIAFGLFTYAVEEYGKALLLAKKHRVSADHKEKFSEAYRTLPSECYQVVYNVLVKQSAPKTVTLGGMVLSIPNNATLELIEMSAGTSATFVARMGCFYVDWDGQSSDWKPDLSVKENSLKTAIQKLKAHIESNTITVK